MSSSSSILLTEEEQYLMDTYQEKEEKQQILDNPDTFIGSVELTTEARWIWSESTQSIQNKEITFVPGLFKLFDEAIVNCRDHVVRMEAKKNASSSSSSSSKSALVSYLDVNVDVKTGVFSLENDGDGIDVAKHPVTGLWVPEMIFGHLRNSTNYNKQEKKIVGGKNGYGVKLIMIWSLWGEIETIDYQRKLKYTQRFGEHLSQIDAPVITKCSEKPRTIIRFLPDYVRLCLPTGLSSDMLAWFQRRVLDMSALTNKKIKIRWNNQVFLEEKKIRDFQHYIRLYFPEEEVKPAYLSSERWEVAVLPSPFHEFTQISFVNGIHTSKGGKHVDYIVNQITKKMGEWIEKKKKKKVASASIKEQLMLFLRCDIENPSFDSQTKEYLTTNTSQFGSSFDLPESWIEKLAKSGIADYACQSSELKTNKNLAKLTKSGGNNVRGIKKLQDAEFAGTTYAKECMLLLCEGDSAKAGILSGLPGLSQEQQRRIGVFPLKGKLLNVKEKTPSDIYENTEIQSLIRILGLEIGKKYTPEEAVKRLRYGKVRFVCDADVDGSHIKGLGMNIFETLWIELFQLPGFLGYMYTPILKATHGQTKLAFYTEKEYETWVNETPNSHLWKIKYYKGLGTSIKQEFMEYFQNNQMVEYVYTGPESTDSIELAFHKKKQDLRKEWIYNKTAQLALNDNNTVITKNQQQTIQSFVHDELVLFSIEDCARSIPSVMDGLKPGMRKIIYCAFKKPLHQEMKVAQFSGYVSEHSCYHHGEASLNQTIIGLAQNFTGSNNIAMLEPNGQFGTRLMGGKDAAQERYIFTQLHPITRKIIPALDDPVLDYLVDQETSVEPKYYVPILPMVLVNGAHGIGTGYSTDILCYSPKDLVTWIQNKLQSIPAMSVAKPEMTVAKPEMTVAKPEMSELFLPYYEGFRGKVERISATQFVFHGIYKEDLTTDTLEITELPIGIWYQDYKEFLEELETPTEDPKTKTKKEPLIKIISLDISDVQIYAKIKFTQKGKLQELQSSGKLESALRLITTKSTTNQVLFNPFGKIHLYSNLQEILEEFYEQRLQLYQKRKTHQLQELEKKLFIENNRAKYLQAHIEDKIDLRKKTKTQIHQMLLGIGLDPTPPDSDSKSESSFEYLLKMRMDSVSEEKIAHILQEKEKTQQQYNILQTTSIETTWLEELSQFLTAYQEYQKEYQDKYIMTNQAPIKKTIKKRIIKNMKEN